MQSVNAVDTRPKNSTPVDLLGSQEDLDRLRLSIVRLYRRIRANSAGLLTPSQLAVFGSIVKHGPCTIGRIAELEHVQPPSASKIVAALEHHGLVAREDDPDDRRRSLIAPTRAGLDYLDGVRAAGRSWLASQLTRLDPDEVDLLESALPALEQLVVAEQ
jgi:DNA-binding MarR family transcriptional regulator